MVNAVSALLPEMQLMILEQLPAANLRLMSLVNTHFAALALDDSLWKQHLQNDFPDYRYTIDWDDCFNQYGSLKKNQLWNGIKDIRKLWVAIEENNLKKIEKLFSKIYKNKYKLDFTIGKLVIEQKNCEMSKFFAAKKRDAVWNDNIRAYALKCFNLTTAVWKKEDLLKASCEGQVEVFKAIYEKHPEFFRWENLDYNLLWSPIREGHFKFVKYFIETFSSIIDKTNYATFANLALKNGHLAIFEILAPYLDSIDLEELINEIKQNQSHELDLLCYFVDKGAEVDWVIERKIDSYPHPFKILCIPLYYAVYRGSYPAVKFLLDKGSNPNIDNPLDLAIKKASDYRTRSYPEIIKILREHGAQTNIADSRW